jgi:hypothetical protein
MVNATTSGIFNFSAICRPAKPSASVKFVAFRNNSRDLHGGFSIRTSVSYLQASQQVSKISSIITRNFLLASRMNFNEKLSLDTQSLIKSRGSPSCCDISVTSLTGVKCQSVKFPLTGDLNVGNAIRLDQVFMQCMCGDSNGVSVFLKFECERHERLYVTASTDQRDCNSFWREIFCKMKSLVFVNKRRSDNAY